MQALFEDRKQPVFDNYAVDDRLIHYAEVQSPGKLLIVFLHGTPGSWYNWAQYMADENLSAKTHLIAVDRPGFGKSAANGVVPSLQKQDHCGSHRYAISRTGVRVGVGCPLSGS
jgi:pimeloyl-ACP methyl ester carboxylesterase